MENDKNTSGINTAPIQLSVILSRGTAIIPTWVMILFASLFVISSTGLVIVLWVESQMVKETRIEQLHIEDVENVLIRSHLADRSDFAPHKTQ